MPLLRVIMMVLPPDTILSWTVAAETTVPETAAETGYIVQVDDNTGLTPPPTRLEGMAGVIVCAAVI